ncbi:MAG: ArsR family transcriptional regulator [Comamonas sp. SCN 67-35]|uniref:ArsR/SmtB family transcription factor n=1 Tax=unclassified Comamonas TaxID=2638500 RepID=UPI00086C9876|nr:MULTISPECIES: metalloregulator ArsR/SmtB family transcription factor [unclassified Comamonas]MBN9329999.1 metalloregulator ArsR/SmtB family transcription factor [Comamonas sp.]ODU39585.1 MAG: ArsR family transcriptional regulator [Comamonas sp. SCN 67-35]OJW99791.1 MAG: ArsR family transcriptional regulator [Burkholderiales bacterium 66-26]
MPNITKTQLYEHVARIGKALASPKRLELIELLAQGEKTVDLLAMQTGMDMRLASAHLRTLREARLVETRREGKFIHYRLSDRDVARLWMNVREVAEEHLVELRLALDQMATSPDVLSPESRDSLLAKASRGDIVVIDVRPDAEYAAGHLPHARSMPLSELRKHLAELPPGKQIVAYCRGPFCLMSDEAVSLLRRRGFTAHKIADGVTEWQASGLPIEH